jgi:hypothetical protein
LNREKIGKEGLRQKGIANNSVSGEMNSMQIP